MENNGSASLFRNRRLESFLGTSCGQIARETPPNVLAKEAAEQRRKPEDYNANADNDGWISTSISVVRIVTCFVTMMFTTLIWALVMLVLLPWPYQRVRQGNVYGHVTGRLLMWILGNPTKIEGSEFSSKKAIYICNHASVGIFYMN